MAPRDLLSSPTFHTFLLLLSGLFFLSLSLFLLAETSGSDRAWNRIMEGEMTFPIVFSEADEVEGKTGLGHSFFENHTLDLDPREWGEERTLMRRTETSAVVNIVIQAIVLLGIVTHGLIIACLVYAGGGEGAIRKERIRLKLGIIVGYLLFGSLLFIGGTIEAVTCNGFAQNYVKLINLLQSKVAAFGDFQYEQNYETTPFFAIDETILLRDIYSICLRHSIYYDVTPGVVVAKEVTLKSEFKMSNGRIYDGGVLQRLGFCQEDGKKVTAVFLEFCGSVVCLFVSLYASILFLRERRKAKGRKGRVDGSPRNRKREEVPYETETEETSDSDSEDEEEDEKKKKRRRKEADESEGTGTDNPQVVLLDERRSKRVPSNETIL